MIPLPAFLDRARSSLTALSPALLGTLARLVFAAVLLMYFWTSGLTKVGPGLFGFLNPSDGAYVQIFPKAAEAAGYDFSKFGALHWLIAVSGTLAELILPLLIILGLLTRLAALGMVGFVLVQSLTDVFGHGAGGDTLGRWFDAASGALILDQRALWVMLLACLAVIGPGPLSLDRLLFRSRDKIG